MVNAAKGKIIHNEVPGKSWKVVEAEMFTLHNKNYLCIVNYHHKFPVIKKIEDLSADSIILACEIIFIMVSTKVNKVRCRGSVGCR